MLNASKLVPFVLMFGFAATSAQAQRFRPVNASNVTGPAAFSIVMNENMGSANASAVSRTVISSVAPMMQNVTRGETFDSLTSPAGAPSAALVSQFLSQFKLVSESATPRRIASASKAFNAMVNGASASYLANPPAEFVSAATVLRKLVSATSK